MAIAEDINGSMRYAIGSVGWKMLKTCAHFGLDTSTSEPEAEVSVDESFSMLALKAAASVPCAGPMQISVLHRDKLCVSGFQEPYVLV